MVRLAPRATVEACTFIAGLVIGSTLELVDDIYWRKRRSGTSTETTSLQARSKKIQVVNQTSTTTVIAK